MLQVELNFGGEFCLFASSHLCVILWCLGVCVLVCLFCVFGVLCLAFVRSVLFVCGLLRGFIVKDGAFFRSSSSTSFVYKFYRFLCAIR